MLPIRTAAPHVPDFTPVPRRARGDGWTDERQREFIASLAATGSVAVACDSVGLHVSGAYVLRGHADGRSFARAWDRALDAGIAALKTVAFDRAVNGVPMTLFYHGEPAATTTRHDNRLLMSLLRHYDRPGTAAVAEPHPGDPSTDTATTQWHCVFQQNPAARSRQIMNAWLLKFLLRVRDNPACLDQEIETATYMAKFANLELDSQLAKANAGPAGMREAAARVNFKLKPIVLTADQRYLAEVAMNHVRGEGPPLHIDRQPLPDGAPDVKVNLTKIF